MIKVIKVMNKKRKEETGFTLLETLIVIGIFGIIMAGVLKVFDTSNYTYKVQEEVAAMQQNVRVSKMFLERDVRMAGCGIKSDFGFKDTKQYSLTFENADGATGSDKLTINYLDYSVDSCDGVLPDLTLTDNMPISSAVADVVEDLTDSTLPNPPPTYSAWDNAFTCGGDTWGGTPFTSFRAIVTSPDGSKSDVFLITQVIPNSNRLQNNGSTEKVINTYPVGSTVSFFDVNQFTRVAYYVSGGVLMRDTIDPDDGSITSSDPIAEDIDDLQFAFGLDTDTDDIVDTWINNADLTDPQKDQVRLVRMSILGRTATEHRGYSNTRQAIEDHAESTNSDGFRRKLLQVTVKVRNLGLG